jgi:hypothetical protein
MRTARRYPVKPSRNVEIDGRSGGVIINFPPLLKEEASA